MIKGILIYTSQNKSTDKAAKEIEKGLTEHNISVEMVNIAKKEAPLSVDEYDVVGIGCPIYYFRPADQLMKALKKISGFDNKKTFTFVTYGTDAAGGGNILRKGLAKKGARDWGHFSCTGRDLFPGYMKQGVIFSPESPLKTELEDARSYGSRIGSEISSGQDQPGVVSAYDKPAFWLYKIESLFLNPFMIKHLFSRMFGVKKDTCTGCGVCVSSCPTKNLEKTEKGHPKWGRDCVLCCLCDTKCPNKAIKSPVSRLLFDLFMAINVGRSKKKGIPYEMYPPKN